MRKPKNIVHYKLSAQSVQPLIRNANKKFPQTRGIAQQLKEPELLLILVREGDTTKVIKPSRAGYNDPNDKDDASSEIISRMADILSFQILKVTTEVLGKDRDTCSQEMLTVGLLRNSLMTSKLLDLRGYLFFVCLSL